MNINPYRKAVAAFLVALTGSLAVAGADSAFTVGEVMSALATAVAAAGAVFGVKNKP